MARSRETVKRETSDESPKEVETKTKAIRVREKGQSVRIRAGAGTNFAHVNGKYLGKGIFEVDEIAKGPGSKSGWGHLANGEGWVGLDFVEILK